MVEFGKGVPTWLYRQAPHAASARRISASAVSTGTGSVPGRIRRLAPRQLSLSVVAMAMFRIKHGVGTSHRGKSSSGAAVRCAACSLTGRRCGTMRDWTPVPPPSVRHALRRVRQLAVAPAGVPCRRVQVLVPEDLGQRHQVVGAADRMPAAGCSKETYCRLCPTTLVQGVMALLSISGIPAIHFRGRRNYRNSISGIPVSLRRKKKPEGRSRRVRAGDVSGNRLRPLPARSARLSGHRHSAAGQPCPASPGRSRTCPAAISSSASQ